MDLDAASLEATVVFARIELIVEIGNQRLKRTVRIKVKESFRILPNHATIDENGISSNACTFNQ